MAPLPLSHDAATVIGLAGTALAFAQSTDEEVERWLRPLRLYGEAGAILQALAIGEAPLAAPRSHSEQPSASRPDQTLTVISAAAEGSAVQRGASVIGTVDILVAVMRHYLDAFERALDCRGTDRWELLERLAGSLHTPLREPLIN